jgi:hypothetical protein
MRDLLVVGDRIKLVEPPYLVLMGGEHRPFDDANVYHVGLRGTVEKIGPNGLNVQVAWDDGVSEWIGAGCLEAHAYRLAPRDRVPEPYSGPALRLLPGYSLVEHVEVLVDKNSTRKQIRESTEVLREAMKDNHLFIVTRPKT